MLNWENKTQDPMPTPMPMAWKKNTFFGGGGGAPDYLAWLYANTDADGMINKKIKYN